MRKLHYRMSEVCECVVVVVAVCGCTASQIRLLVSMGGEWVREKLHYQVSGVCCRVVVCGSVWLAAP